jgi:site-specific recombinase XerD
MSIHPLEATIMSSSDDPRFRRNYEAHRKHLALKGLRPKTIDAYSRAIRRIGHYFHYDITDLSREQLLDYFSSRLATHSWSAVKLDLYGLKFFYRHVLEKPWTELDLVKLPRPKRLPNVLTVGQAAKLFSTTRELSYRVLFFVLYSLGLRLGEGISLQVGDIDAARHRVHIRSAKGDKDRFVPLPDRTLDLLRRFWLVHRHPTLLFPNRKGGLLGAPTATTPVHRGGVQLAMRRVVADCGIKKSHSPHPASQLRNPSDRSRRRSPRRPPTARPLEHPQHHPVHPPRQPPQ